MRITKISIKNYRQYKDCTYSFPRGKHDLHLFLGRGTQGKSNFLNAINWCLYNEEPHLKMADRSLPIPNLHLFDTLDDEESLRVEVIVEIQDDDKCMIEFKRTAEFYRSIAGGDVKSKNQKFKVYKQNENGGYEPYDNQQGQPFVDMYFPSKIRDIFFMDGEDLRNYFSESTAKQIKNAITVVSKIQMLEVMVNRLSNVLDGKRKEVSRNSPDLIKLDKELTGFKNEKLATDKEIESLEDQLSDAKAEKARLDDDLRATPDIESDEKEILNHKSQNSKLEALKKAKDAEYNTSAIEYITYQYLLDDMLSIKAKITDLRKKNQLPPPVNSELLEQVLHEGQCKICNTKLSKEMEESIGNLLKSIKSSTALIDLLMELGNQVTSNLNSYDKGKKRTDRIWNEIREFNTLITDNEIKIQEIEKKIDSIPNREEIKEKRIRRGILEDLIPNISRMLGTKTSESEGLKKLIEAKQTEFERAMKKKEVAGKIRNEMAFCEEMLKIAKKAKDELIEETRLEVQEKTQEKFFRMNWVSSKYTGVVLNKNYEVNVTHETGYSGIGSLSGSELVLLALSYILALHDLSNLSSPLIIDTPTYNMEGDNLTNFAQVLSTLSIDKQIVLMLTPKEYAIQLEEVFNPVRATLKEIVTENKGSILKER